MEEKEELRWPTQEEIDVPVRRIFGENYSGEQEFPYEQAMGWLYRGNARDDADVQKTLMMILPRFGASIVVPMKETFKVTLLMCDENNEPKRHEDELKFDYTEHTATFKNLNKILSGAIIRSVMVRNGYVNLQPSRFNEDEILLTTWFSAENTEDIYVYHIMAGDHKYRTKHLILNGFRRIQNANFKYNHATDEECKTVLDYLAPKYIADMTITEKPLSTGSEEEAAETEAKYYCIVDRESVNFFQNQFAAIPVKRCKLWTQPEDDTVDKMLIFHQLQKLRIITHKIQFDIPDINDVNGDFLRIVRQMGPLTKSSFKNHEMVLQTYRQELENKRLAEERLEQKRKQIEEESNKNRSHYDNPFHGRRGMGRPPRDYPFRRPRGDFEGEMDEALEGGSRPNPKEDDHISSLRQNKGTLASYHDSLLEAEKTYAVVDEISLPWVVAEGEIKNILESGIVPETDVLSGGLDPNNAEHFLKCMQEIQHQLSQQNYDVALSRLQGTKKIFSECPLPEMAELLNIEDLELLKKLYYQSFA